MSELLPIPPGVRSPDAYQVFGMTGPVEDMKVVAAAIRQTIERLQAAKGKADADQWKAAAKTVKDAKAVLADPIAKANLDQRLRQTSDGNQAKAGAAAKPESKSAADPLAGILPMTDPLAGVLPRTDPMAVSSPAATDTPAASERAAATDSAAKPPATDVVVTAAATPDAAAPAANAPTSVSSPTAADAIEVPEPPRLTPAAGDASVAAAPAFDVVTPAARRGTSSRRKGKKAPVFLMSLICLALMALIGLLGYVVFNPRVLAELRGDTATPKDLKPTVAPPSTAADSPAKTPPRNTQPTRPIDPVMGSLAGNVPPPPMASPTMTSPPMSSPTRPTAQQPVGESMNESPASPAMAAAPGGMAGGPNAMASGPAVASVDPAGAVNEPTEQQLAAAQSRLQQAAQRIRNQDWDDMQTQVDSLRGSMMTEMQKRQFEALSTVAELAVFFRKGIEMGISRQSAGGQLEIGSDIIVGVVSIGPDNRQITLNVNARPRSYEIDSMPFTLADRLASFVITPENGFDVAAAVYHCVAPERPDGTLENEFAFLRQRPNLTEVTGDVTAEALIDALTMVASK